MFTRFAVPKKAKSEDTITTSDVIYLIKTEECVILYSPWCRYSRMALELLNENRIQCVSIKIEDINDTMSQIVSQLAKSGIPNFDGTHRTRPMIFIDGKFIGGFSELQKLLN